MNKTGMTLNELFSHQKKNHMIEGNKHVHLLNLIKENNRLLSSCEYHEFTIELSPNGGLFGMKYECANCGGEVDWSHKKWYETGLEHARKMKETL